MKIYFLSFFIFFLTIPSLAWSNPKVPDFKMLNQNQEEVSPKNYLGKYWILNFFFTSCPAICPMINGKVFTLYKQFENKNNLNFLSISVDPKRDTFPALINYAKKFSANSDRWQFARGESEQVNKLVEELKLSAGPIIDQHNTRLTLIDPEGKILGYYSATDPEAFPELQEKLTKLLK